MTTTTSPPTTDGSDTVHQLNQSWCDAFNAGDIDQMMSMYEDDAVLVPGPGADPLSGHVAIREALHGFLGLGGTLRFTPRFWLERGDLAMGSIAFVMDGGTDPSGQPVDLHGVTAEVARRQADGTWRYVVDHPFGGADA